MEKIFIQVGVAVPEILLPRREVSLLTWSVVACDQYTSQRDYWQNVESLVQDTPSTLHIIYPEVYLEDEDKSSRIARIHESMKKYLSDGTLQNVGPCFVLIDRKTSHAASRKGLIVALDLDRYDYHVGSQSLIRATEGTVLDRLPPRIAIRKEAPLETPHIMVLIDDEKKTVIEPLFAQLSSYEKLYDTDLMMDGGHITGYKIDKEEAIQQVIGALEVLRTSPTIPQTTSLDTLLFAMGDGNHSFATAKAIREEKKLTLTPEQQHNHPARFALVELVNIHDSGLSFEPIHRVLFNVDKEILLHEMQQYCESHGSHLDIAYYPSQETVQSALGLVPHDHHAIAAVFPGGYALLDIQHPSLTLEVGSLQAFLDDYLKAHLGSKIDYVHGREVTASLGMQQGNMGFLLPIMDKRDFFKTVIVDGALPRKTFSMGEAEEKRFYFECRALR